MMKFFLIVRINTVGELITKENDGKDICKTKAGDDVNSANPSTHPQAHADVDSANPNAPLDGASVNGSDCIKDSLEVEKNGKTAKHKLKLYGAKAVRTKNYLDALKLYTQAIQMDPDDAILYSNRSLCHLQIGEANKALLDANSCIKIRPEFVKGYYWKGIALMSLKRGISGHEGLCYT